MNDTTLRALGRSLVAVATAALVAACAGEGPLDPGGAPKPTHLPPVGAPADLQPRDDAMQVALGACEKLRVPAGSKLAYHAYASGVQIYHWNGSGWVFVAPIADLYADARGHGRVGTHFAGPTWTTNSGSTVVGAVVDRCTPNAEAIPWLLLSATPDAGPGVFHRTAFIQRVNTTGGLAPTEPGRGSSEERHVPYTAEYYFYRAP